MIYDGISVKAFSPEVDDLSLINRFTRREFTAAELYTFSVILCDNEIDRDFERFTNAALDKLAALFQGKTGIFDHIPSGKNQAARIFHAEVLCDAERITKVGEPYRYLCAKAYMVRQGNEELIAEIDGGIKKEVSVGCSVASARCSICGVDRREGCEHKKSVSYNEKLCHHILDDPTDAYEWSFVAVPAQVGAGVTKAYQGTNQAVHTRSWDEILKVFDSGGQDVVLSEVEVRTVRDQLAALKKDAASGAVYRENLMKEVRRLAFLAGEEIPVGIFDSVVQKMDVSELTAFRSAYEARLNGSGVRCQLGGSSSGLDAPGDSGASFGSGMDDELGVVHGGLNAFDEGFGPYEIR